MVCYIMVHHIMVRYMYFCVLYTHLLRWSAGVRAARALAVLLVLLASRAEEPLQAQDHLPPRRTPEGWAAWWLRAGEVEMH